MAILGCWATGMLVLIAVSIVSYLRFLRCLAGCPVEEVWLREWNDLLVRHGVGRRVPLWVTVNVGPLLCFGPRGYRLVVPAGLWQRLAPAGRLSILRHELAHLRRCDLWKSILVRLLMLPHWFNPLAWLAMRRFDEAAEWACDELAKGADWEGCRAYAAALLQLDAASGPRPSYHAAASGRGLSLRIQRLLSPQVKEDSIMKKTVILAVALGLALVCLVRLNLVAKEPAAKDRADVPVQTPSGDSQLGATLGAMVGAAVGEAVGPPQKMEEPKTSIAADALRYMPNGCRLIAWWDMPALRKACAEGEKGFASCLGLSSVEFFGRATVGSMGQGLGLPPNVAVVSLTRPVTVSELKENAEKEAGKHPWCEETIKGVTVYVQEDDEPIAFCLPAERTLVVGAADLVREVLVRQRRAQLPDKLAEAWARLDPSHAIGLMMPPPAAGDQSWSFVPDELREKIEAMLIEADAAAGENVRFRLSLPCSDADTAQQLRGVCSMVCKFAGAESPDGRSLENHSMRGQRPVH